jgi:hypothetical protein
MDKIFLKKMTKKDFPLIKQWLENDILIKYYKPIDQLRKKINGENDYNNYFTININLKKVGICQYYDCFTTQKYCKNINKENIRYCIDYIIIECGYSSYQHDVIKKLINKIKNKNGKEIIIELETVKKHLPTLMVFGFELNEEERVMIQTDLNEPPNEKIYLSFYDRLIN